MAELAKVANCYTSCYPNAGLPNPLSETGYDEKPEDTGKFLRDFAEEGFVNMVGGCCGTTEEAWLFICCCIIEGWMSSVATVYPGLRTKILISLNNLLGM